MDIPIFGTAEKGSPMHITGLTEDRIRKFTREDLKIVFSSLTEKEADLMVKNIQELRFDIFASVMEVATWREMQKEVKAKLKLK